MSYLLCVILFAISASIIYLWCLVYNLNKTLENIVSSNSKIAETNKKGSERSTGIYKTNP